MIPELLVGMRFFRREPLLSVVVVLTLAVAMTANSTIFALLYGLLLRPLPFSEPDELVKVYGGLPDGRELTTSIFPPAYYGLARDHDLPVELAAIVAGSEIAFSIKVDSGERIEVPGGVVSANLFSLLGVELDLGRLFEPEEDVAGWDSVVILSSRLWHARFGGDPSILGRTLELNDQPFTVIGVLSEGFEVPRHAQLWIPNPAQAAQVRNLEVPVYSYLEVIGRLDPGTSLEAASEELDARYRAIVASYPDAQASDRIILRRLRRDDDKRVATAVPFLQVAVTAVLLMACGNITGLLLVRALRRRGEFAVRAVLGATFVRLIRQLVSESLILFVAGGVVAMLASGAVLNLISANAPADTSGAEGLGVDPITILFSLSVAVLCGLIFGSLPAFCLLGSNRLGQGILSGNSASRRYRLLGELVVVVQLGLSLAMLVSAGLMVRSVMGLRNQPLGFSPESVLSVDLTLHHSRYSERQERMVFIEQLESELSSLPGVTAVGGTQFFFLTDGTYHNVISGIRGSREQRMPELEVAAAFVTRGYFDALGVRFEEGRAFEKPSGYGNEEVVVTRWLARALSEEGGLAGHEIEFEGRWWRVVGIASDLLMPGAGDEPAPALFLPLELAMLSPGNVTILVRSSAETYGLAKGIRQRIDEIDPFQAVGRIVSVEEEVRRRSATESFGMRLLAAFAVLAILVAAIGIHGLLGYAVAVRRRDFGIRMAVGATPGRVHREIARRALVLGLCGMAVGAVLATLAGQALSTLLYGVEPWDPITWALALLTALVVAAACSWVPGRRAARVDPAVILREE